MGAVPSGQGSPAGATAKRRWGKRFCRTAAQAKGRQNGGAPPSLTRRCRARHPWKSVSQAPPQSDEEPSYQSSAKGLSYRVLPVPLGPPGGTQKGSKDELQCHLNEAL